MKYFLVFVGKSNCENRKEAVWQELQVLLEIFCAECFFNRSLVIVNVKTIPNKDKVASFYQSLNGFTSSLYLPLCGTSDIGMSLYSLSAMMDSLAK